MRIVISLKSTHANPLEASYPFAALLRALADRLEGHPHFSPGACQPLKGDCLEGRFDIFEDTTPE